MVLNRLLDNKAEAHPKFRDVSGFPVLRNDATYIGRACYLPGCKEVPGNHDYYVIYYIVEGDLLIHFEGESAPIALGKGDTIMFEPGDKTHYAENASVHPVEMLCINVFNK